MQQSGLELPPLESQPDHAADTGTGLGTDRRSEGVGRPQHTRWPKYGAFTGVRRNEALALRFNDIEWFVQRGQCASCNLETPQVQDGAAQMGVAPWTPPRSRQGPSQRIAATESVMKMLADLKVGKPGTAHSSFPAEMQWLHRPGQDSTLRFGSLSQEKADMAGTRFHDLRHFFASQLDRSKGEPAAYVRDQMGHSQHQGYLRYLRASLPRPRPRKPAPATRSRWGSDAKIRHNKPKPVLAIR